MEQAASLHSLLQNWTPEQEEQGKGLFVQVRQCQQWDFTWNIREMEPVKNNYYRQKYSKTNSVNMSFETSYQLSVEKADIRLLLGNQLAHLDLSGSHCKPTSTLFIPGI